MARKNLNRFFLTVSCFLFGACATPSHRPSVGASERSIPVSPLPPPLTHPGEVIPSKTEEVPADLKPSLPSNRKKTFAFWIDGAGLESVAAIGFLQEFEKAGIKPRKIVGGGFGCWVALSWALDNNGNRAEWQAFKWTSWDEVGPNSLLGRLTSRTGHQKFSLELRRLLPVKDLNAFKIPVDCPLYEKKYPYRMFSGRSTDFSTMLWNQFQLPLIGNDPDAQESAYYSAGLAGGPMPRELDEMARDIPSDPESDFGGWIILRTRGPNDRGASQNWINLVGVRQDQFFASGGFSPSGLAFVVMDLSDGAERPALDARKFENRRRWLLEGRRRAQLVLQSDELKKFLQPPIAH